MNKVVKRILVILLSAVLVVGAIFGGLSALNIARKNPVNVYELSNFAMTDYWGDTSNSYGEVTTDNLQNVYISETQIVTDIYVTEGQKVSVGDPLLKFDTTLSDIALERAQNNVEKLRLSLENAKAELEVIKRMVPHYSVLITPENIPSDTVSLDTPFYLGGHGTLEEPHCFMWGQEDMLSDGFLKSFYEVAKAKREEEEAMKPSDPTEPIEETGEAEDIPETENPEVEEEPKEKGFYLFFMIREENKIDGIIQSQFGIYLVEKDGELVFRPYQSMVPAKYQYEYIPQEPYYEEHGSMYTSSEIARMRSEKEKEIADLDISLKSAEVELKQMEEEVNNGMIVSRVDGYVQNLISTEEAMMFGTPLMCVTDGGGYYINVSLSELEMSTVQVGQTVSVSSWETGTYCEGTITEISEFPATNYDSWGGGNNNVTYYPFVVYVDGSNQLREGSYVSVSYEVMETDTDCFYLEKPFIRTENGKSFVYVRNENGLLEQRILKVGKTIWGSYVQVFDGITIDDYIAFPYGRDVKDGAKTKEATIDEFYSMY